MIYMISRVITCFLLNVVIKFLILILFQNGLLIMEANNMGCLDDFSHICEPHFRPLDALNLTNGTADSCDSNLESFSSFLDFCLLLNFRFMMFVLVGSRIYGILLVLKIIIPMTLFFISLIISKLVFSYLAEK